MSCYLLDSPDRPDLAPYLAIADEFCALPLLHEDQALEWSYLDGETDVVPSRLKSAAELLVLRHDPLKLIDGAGPEALAPSQNKAEEPSANGKEPEQQTVPENVPTARNGERTGTHEQNSQLHVFWRAGFHRSQTIYRQRHQLSGMSSTFEECVRSPRSRASSGSNRTPGASSRRVFQRNVGRPQEKQTGT
jgi:hypothetical protein